MSDLENRSLRKLRDKLPDADKAFLRQYTCQMADCGADFAFTISMGTLAQDNNRLKKYNGHCAKCGQKIVLAHGKYQRWQKLIKGSKLTVTDNTYDQLFDES